MGSALSSVFGYSAAAATADSSSSDDSGVLTFHSPQRWQLHFNSLKDSPNLMVIDFAASWCGPCKFMEPELKNMATLFKDVCFAKIDVDELPDVAQEFGVQAMPTFVLVKKGKEIDRILGAKKDELIKKIEKHRSL